MRIGVDPRLDQFWRMLNQLEDAARVLPRWPKPTVEGPGGGPGSTVLVNVSGLDLAREIHAVLVPWCDQVAEQRGVEGIDPAWSTWAQTPSGSWVATGGNTGEVAQWLRSQGVWVVDQVWYVEEMWPELLELRRKARGLMGLYRPPRSMRDAVIEAAAAGGSLEEMREVARARRAEA